MSSRYYHRVRHEDLVRATRALLKFCAEHDGVTEHFATVLRSLEADDFPAAWAQFRSNPPRAWADWFPPVAYPNDKDYVWEVFLAISERWCRLMLSAAGEWKWPKGHPFADRY